MDDASMVSYHNDNGTLEVGRRHEALLIALDHIPVFAREEAEVLDVVH